MWRPVKTDPMDEDDEELDSAMMVLNKVQVKSESGSGNYDGAEQGVGRGGGGQGDHPLARHQEVLHHRQGLEEELLLEIKLHHRQELEICVMI